MKSLLTVLQEIGTNFGKVRSASLRFELLNNETLSNPKALATYFEATNNYVSSYNNFLTELRALSNTKQRNYVLKYASKVLAKYESTLRSYVKRSGDTYVVTGSPKLLSSNLNSLNTLVDLVKKRYPNLNSTPSARKSVTSLQLSLVEVEDAAVKVQKYSTKAGEHDGGVHSEYYYELLRSGNYYFYVENNTNTTYYYFHEGKAFSVVFTNQRVPLVSFGVQELPNYEAYRSSLTNNQAYSYSEVSHASSTQFWKKFQYVFEHYSKRNGVRRFGFTGVGEENETLDFQKKKQKLLLQLSSFKDYLKLNLQSSRENNNVLSEVYSSFNSTYEKYVGKLRDLIKSEYTEEKLQELRNNTEATYGVTSELLQKHGRSELQKINKELRVLLSTNFFNDVLGVLKYEQSATKSYLSNYTTYYSLNETLQSTHATALNVLQLQRSGQLPKVDNVDLEEVVRSTRSNPFYSTQKLYSVVVCVNLYETLLRTLRRLLKVNVKLNSPQKLSKSLYRLTLSYLQKYVTSNARLQEQLKYEVLSTLSVVPDDDDSGSAEVSQSRFKAVLDSTVRELVKKYSSSLQLLPQNRYEAQLNKVVHSFNKRSLSSEWALLSKLDELGTSFFSPLWNPDTYATYSKSVGSLYTLKPKALQRLLTRRGKLYYKALQTYGVASNKVWYDGTVLLFEV